MEYRGRHALSRSRRMSRRAPDVDAAAAVRAIYTELAARPIERACVARTECCRFKLTGKTPYLTKGEALVAAKAWRATGAHAAAGEPGWRVPAARARHGPMPDLRRPTVWLPHALLRHGGRAVCSARSGGSYPPAGRSRPRARRRGCAAAAVRPRAGAPRAGLALLLRHFPGATKRLQRLFFIPDLCVENRQMLPSLGETRVDLHGLLKGGDGLRVFARLHAKLAP